MPARPRSHQIEDQSRLAFARALPPSWTVERVVHDYGLDLRVEIFQDDRPTGLFFFVQLKATDRLPSKRGISVRLRPEHLNYWNRLPVPTLVVLWVAPTDVLYGKWAHLHHPWPRTHAPKTESFHLSLSDLLLPVNPAALADEVSFCNRARSGRLTPPIEVHVEAHPRNPCRDANLKEFVKAWSRAVDGDMARLSLRPGTEQARVMLGKSGFAARLGRATLSSIKTDDSLDPSEIVDDAACALGLILCNGGNPDLGVAILAEHGRRSKMLSALCRIGQISPLPNPAHVLVQLEKFDVGLQLAQSWRAQGGRELERTASELLAVFKFYEAKMPDQERNRLDQMLGDLPILSPLMAPESRLAFADSLADHGYSAWAAAQYALLSGSSDAAAMEDRTLERLSATHRASAEYDQAIQCLVELVRRHPRENRWRLDLGICKTLAGEYAEALVFLTSVSDSEFHGEAWSWTVTASLARMIAGPSQVRQPAGAEGVLRRSLGGTDPEEREKLFEEAARFDAVAVSTWTIYFGALGADKPPLGGIGVVPLALVSWDDAEWWALALSVLATHGQADAFLRVAECALRAIGDEFPALVRNGFSPSGFADDGIAEVVSAIAQLKAEGKSLCVREMPPNKEVGHLAYLVEAAPPGYRLFDFDLPPVETWFDEPPDPDLS